MKIYDVRGIGANLTGSFSGSFDGLFAGTVEGISATASYVEYTNVANKPALVSGSAQIEGFGIFATTGSNQFNGNQAITGSLTTTGQIVAQTLNVQQVTSSIVYSSGSNIFGNSLANTQQFTGSLQVSGSSHYILGSVGVGTTSPLSRFHVNTGTNQNFRVRPGTDVGATNGVALNSRTDDDGSLQQLTLRASDVIMLTSGNVGIGTGSPLGPLEVRAANRAVSSDGILQVNTTNSQAIDLGGSLTFGGMYQNSGTIPTEWAGISGRKENSTNSNYAGYLSLGTRPMGGVITERMRISSTGASTFISPNNLITDGSDSNIEIRSNTAYNADIGGSLGFGGFFNTTASTNFAIIAGKKENATINNLSGYLAFYTRGALTDPIERMRITSAGNVGIGVTPSAWASPTAGKVIQLGNRASVFSYNNGTLDLATNFYFDGSDYRYLQSAFATLLRSDSTNGTFVFYNAASGTAGGVVSLTERMRITSDGYLWVNGAISGFTASQVQMQVNGQTRFGGDILLHNGSNVAQAVRLSCNANDSFNVQGSLVVTGTLPVDQTSASVIDHFSSKMRIFSYGASGTTGTFEFRNAAGGAGSNLVATINASGVYTAVSDINKKKDFEDSTIGLNAILGLKPTLYRMRNNESEDEKELGFIAQEVKEFIPQAYVESGEEDEKFIGLNYNAIVAALVKSVQELKAEIQLLKQQ